jgi:hypothetical protein
MNQQLQSQLAEILKQMLVAVNATKDFSMKELPDIALQYVRYGFWSNILGAVISGAFIIALIFCFKRLLRWTMEEMDNNNEDAAAGIVGLFFTAILIFLAFTIKFYPSVESLILNITAPKVWLILEIKNLLS